MSTIASRYRTLSSVTSTRTLAAGFAILLASGVARADSVAQLVAFAMTLCAAALPGLLWIRAGGPGVPVFPVIALAHIPAFTLPAVSQNESLLQYGDQELFDAALMVTLYLAVATIPWHLLSMRALTRRSLKHHDVDDDNLKRLIVLGLSLGLAFQVALTLGYGSMLGSMFGVARSVAVTFVIVACFLTGVARARGTLRASRFAMAVGAIVTIVLTSWTSLFLVGGLVYALATMLGYVIVARRIPWLTLLPVLLVAGILHSGKGEMRSRYWMEDLNFGAAVSVVQAPAFILEWLGVGMSTMLQGEVESNILQRSSLMQMVLLVRSVTPQAIGYMGGETYSLLPQIILPRFLEANKPASQIGMDMLNVRYGLLSSDETAVTAIGWGLVAEAYANFGYVGVLAMGLLVGCFCGALALWSRGKPVVSIAVLFNIGAMMAMINLELDFIQLVSVLLQTLASLLLFFAFYGWLVLRQSAAAMPAPRRG